MPYECHIIPSRQQYKMYRLLVCALFTVVDHSIQYSVDNGEDIQFLVPWVEHSS